MTTGSQPPSVRRTLRRVLRVLAVLLVVAILGVALWARQYGEAWLERTVRARIAGVIDEASVQGYRFRMQGLETDVREGRLAITGVELDFGPELLDSLRQGTFHYLFAARAERIELRGLSYWRLLLHREFRVAAFELKGPALSYLIGGDRVALADPFTRLHSGGRGLPIALLAADTLLVRKASAVVQDLGERLPELNVSGLELQGTAVRITMGKRRGGVRLTVGGAELQLDSLRTQMAEGDELSIQAVRLSRSRRSGRVGHVRSVSHRPDTTDAAAVQRSVLDLDVDSLVLSDLDVDRLITDQALHIGHLAVHGLRVGVELDKTLRPTPPLPKALPPAALLAIPFPVRIDTLLVVDAEAVYRERDANSRRWGRLPFRQLNGRFVNITNETEVITERQSLTGEFAGVLFDTAQVVGAYGATLDGSQKFGFTATVTELPLIRLNDATGPLLRIQVDGGQLHRLYLRMDGDEQDAKATLSMNYTDLLARVEPGTPRAQRHGMLGNVMEAMLDEAYGGGLSADHARTYNLDRDANRSLLTYVWHALREGLARNLAPQAWDRMRLMLRTDAEQRRQLRAARRARKQKRE